MERKIENGKSGETTWPWSSVDLQWKNSVQYSFTDASSLLRRWVGRTTKTFAYSIVGLICLAAKQICPFVSSKCASDIELEPWDAF